MAGESDQSIHLPAALQVRLDAAGVTDQASLEAALHADPKLKQDFVAFLSQHQAAIAQVMMQQWLTQFAAVPDQAAMAQFWQQVPMDMEDSFLVAVEQAIIEVQQSNEAEAAQVAEGLRVRLDGLKQVRAQQAEIATHVEQWAEKLIITPDEDVFQLWNTIPLDLEDEVLAQIEQHAAGVEQDGDAAQAACLHVRIAALRQMQVSRLEPDHQPPVVRALLAFVQADTTAAARQVYTTQSDLLQPNEAQELLDEWADAAAEDLQEHILERSDLLRIWRGRTQAGDLLAE